MSSFRDLVKTVNAQKKTVPAKQERSEEEDKHSSFKDLVKKVNDGTVGVVSKLKDSEVNDWYSGVKSVSQEGYNLLSKEGYRGNNTSLAEKINSYLSQANDVAQYIRANRNSFANYEETMQNYHDTVSYLRSLQKGIDNSNKYFSQWADENAYKKSSLDTREDRQQQYVSNEEKVKELNDFYDKAYTIETWYNSYRMNPGAWDKETVKENMAIYDRLKKEYGSLDALDREIGRLSMENTSYKRGENGYTSKVVDDYYDVTENADFLNVSGNRNYDNPTREELIEYDSLSDSSSWYFDANGVYRDAYGNELKVDEKGNWVNPNATDQKYQVTDRLGMFLGTSQSDILDATGTSVGSEGAWESVIKDGVDGSWKELTDNEVAIYYYLLNSAGQETADKYLSDMKTELNRRETMKQNQLYLDAYDEANLLEKIALNVATVPAKFVSNITGSIENAANTLMGNEINPYSAAQSGMHFGDTIRGATADELDKTGIKIPLLDFTLGDVYQTAMSRIDSALATGVGGGAGTILLGMGSAQSEAYRLYKSGASMDQIAWGAAAAGAAEVVFEYVSFDKLVHMKDAKTLGQVIKNALIQGGIEASEEGMTEIANLISNAIIMGQQSDVAQLLEANGGDQFKTFLDLVKQTSQAAFGGFLGGFGAGLGESQKAYSANKEQFKEAGYDIMGAEGGVDALKALAEEVAGVSDATMKAELSKQAGKVSSEVASGDGIRQITSAIKNNQNAVKVGRLYDTVSSANDQANAAQNRSDVAKSLRRSGFDHDTAYNIADALVASYNGQELTKAQTKLLKSVEGNGAVGNAVHNILSNTKSTVGQRRQNIRDFVSDVNAGRFAKTAGVSLDTAKKIRDGIYAPELEKVTEGSYEVSAEGKTIRKSDGEIVNIQGIASITKGKLILQTDNGTIDASEVSYASKDQALVYEAVANLGNIIDVNAANKLVQGFSKANGMAADVYARGVAQAYTYGYYGYSMADAMGEKTMSAELTESQRQTAFALGRANRKTDAAKAQEERAKYKAAFEEAKATGKKGGVYFRSDSMETSDIDSYLEKAGTVLNDTQKVSIETMKNLSEALGVEFYVFESYMKNGKRYYVDEDGTEQEGAPNGWYDTKSGKVYIDLHAGASGRGTMLFTIAHELTHFIRQWSPEKFNKLADIIFQHGDLKGDIAARVAIKMAKAKNRGKPISYDVAHEEVVADGMESILKSGRVMEMVADIKQQDRGLWQKICEWFKDLADYLKRVVDAYQGKDPDSYEGKAVASMKGLIKQIEAIYADALVDASENYQSFMTMAEHTEVMDVGSGTLHSYSSLAEAAGFEAVENADGTRAFMRNGSKVTKVTVEDIENSPIGALINFSLEKNDISKADADRQKKMFTEICTMACKTNDFGMSMQFIGSAVFTGMKANADKQYGTTYDFPSICTKTQAVIDAMSAKMVKLGRGLSKEEIVDIYTEVFASGNPVPCPECYVFSRWIGIGGLLDNIKKYQDYYGNMSVEDAAAAYRTMRDEVAKFAEEQGISFGKAKGALTSKLTKEFNKLTEKVEKAQNQGEKVKPADTKRLAELEPMMNTVKGMTWLENVYFADSSLKKVNPRFRVPDSVLFDLNNGEAFATQYKEAWAFRTTQGAGYGKAITPYAEARLGEGILVTNNTTNAIKGKAQGTLDNYFLRQMGKLDKKSKEALNRARLKQKIQAFIGGQRFQSTSDARYENASDYLLAALEMQAMAGMVQVYTKVDGAVPAFSAWGFSINQSLMPLGGGLDEDGNVKDTSVGGMSPKIAFKNRDKHESAGTITIGVNDNHIRAMFKEWVRDFIIPYHASGGKAEVVAAFRDIQEGQEKGGKMVRSTDYSRTQSDKVLSDEVLRWQGKTAAQIQRIHEVRDARIAILTGGKVDMAVVRSNRFLTALYDKLHGGEWDGVKLAKSKVESQIFPNEYWDQTVSYEDSGKITSDYLEYCNDLGFLHRFSGMVPSNGKLIPVNGYDQNGQRVQLTDLAYQYDENGNKTDKVEPFFWKVLTDRRMYDNEGNYLPQKVVTLNDTTTDTVTGFAKVNYGRQYNKEVSMETAAKVANIRFSERETLEQAADAMETIEDAEYLEAKAKHPFIIVMDHTPKIVLNSMEGEPKAADRRVLIRRDALYLAIRKSGVQPGNYHDLGKEVLKELPKYLENPDAILKTDNNSAKRLVLTSIPVKSGHAVVSVEFESIKDFEGVNEYFNVIVTVFDLHKNYLKSLFKKHSAEIKYEKEDLVQVNPQLHEWLRTFNTKSSDGMVTQPEEEVKRNSDREDLTADQQKNFDYNQKQSTVGSTLKTLKGSAIKRSTKYGVGKEIGGEIYFHKEYAEDIVPAEVLSQAERLLEEENPGFEYNCLKYNAKTGVVAFQEAPDFDSAREPMVGDYVSVNTDTGAVKTGHSNYIWHHKWNWVKNDYSGFDVEESWNWSKQWLSTLTEVSDGNGVERWNAQLDKFGLPHDGALFSEREQEYDSKDTSVKILPATFTKFGLKATDRVLDWGGGQYDIAKKAVELGYPGIKFEVVDIFNRTKTHNDRILEEYKANPATVLTINNVLNVIKETDIIEDVIRESKEYLAEDGVCYIKIYEGNDVDGKTGNGKVTSSGWQNNQPATWYIPFAKKYYQYVEPVGDILVASDNPINKKALPKADKATAKVMRDKVAEIRKEEPSMRESLYSDRIDTSDMDEDAKEVIRNLKLNRMGSKYGYGEHKYASYTEERISREIADSWAKGVPDYAHSYIAWIDPEDFLRATTTTQEYYERIKSEAGDLDHQKLMNETQPIYLRIDGKTNKIIGHEGRHRISALNKAGYDRVAVIVKVDSIDLYGSLLFPERHMKLKGQEFEHWGNGGLVGTRKGVDFWVSNMLPLSEKYADAARKLFSEVDGSLRYQERAEDSVSNRSLLANAFEGLAQNDIEKQKIQEYRDKISLINSEERKLTELNEQIKELSFAKGPRDTQKIRDLQFEARQTANRINTYDKQLLRLEASKPLQDVLAREKEQARKREKQKGKEALEAYRERTMKTQRELLEKWQESRKKGIESRSKTAMRHKIKDVVNELNQYLLRGTKDRHVPIELQKAVAEALDAVNMDTVGAEERIAKLKDELLKAKTPEAIQEISRKIDHVQAMGDKMNGRLKKLRDAYDQFVNSDDPLIANSHDDVISNKLQSVIEAVGDTPLRDMNLTQLEDVYDMYRMVLTTIRNANKAFKAKKSESISTIANRVMMEVEQVGGKKKLTVKGMDGIKGFGWNNLKPVYAFQHIGSDSFTEVFNNVRAGEDVWAVDVTEAREFYLDKSKKHGYGSWDIGQRFNFTSASGMEFSLDLEQIMSLYAYSKRDQAAEHLKKGGIVIDETTEITMKTKLGIPVKFNPTEATAYNISDETLAEIISKLTKEQKAFVDEMQDYLSVVMGAKGNEVSLEMYGVKLFKEKFYFPLKSAQQFMAKAKEQAQGEVKIKNSGFSKETVQKASNPIVLTPFMNVWSNHVNEMSMYHAFVLPMEDFYRVYNYKTPTSDTTATESVEMFIQNAYGKGATKYIDQLLKDLNGGARTDHTTGIISKMMGLFKKGAVFASLSVVVQQPSAVARAAALVDTKYFIGPKVDHKRHKALWNEVKQYAPVAIIKEMGYFDTNMGKSTQDFILGKEYSGFSEKMKALVTDSNYRDELLSKAPALADEVAWCSIWEAVKRETKDKYPGLDVNGEPFLKLAGSRFTEVIVKTQVYDSVLSRSGLMRSKDTGMKMATAFMAEPTTSINMIADALLQGKRGNRKYCRTAIGAVLASQIINSILVSFVYAGRDDDEDETYVEKYIGTLTGEVLDSLNPAGYIPFIKDIMSIVQGYDVERSDMAVVSDMWNAVQNLSKDSVPTYRKVEGFAGSIAQIFGLPVKNIMRDARGIYQTVMSFVNGQQTTKAGIVNAVKSAVTGKDVSNQQQLYEAYLSGDKTQIARVEGRFKDQTAINSAIRKALRENDPRIKGAAVARYNGDIAKYTSIAKQIIGEKHFSQDNVVAAINAEINALDKEETTTTSTKASGLYKAEDFAVAISQGDQAMANAIKVDIIQTAQKNGKTADEAEKSFVSSAKSALKEMFLTGEISEQKAAAALTTYCDIEEADALADVQYWVFKQANPDTYVDDAWVDEYYEEVADSGISIEVFVDYRNRVKSITGENKKEKRMAVIDSMPISSAQKDALYYAEGWTKSKLYEAPWH